MDHITMNTEQLTNKAMKIMYVKNKGTREFVKHIFETCSSSKACVYHNKTHTFEVLQMATRLMKMLPKNTFSKQEKVIVQVTALCHDYGHLGISNTEWDASFSSVRSASTVSSHNENMHIEKSSPIIDKYLNDLKLGEYGEEIWYYMSKMILSTDLRLHDQYLDLIKQDKGTISNMVLIIKLADLSHFFREKRLHILWVYRIYREMNGEEAPSIDFISKDTIWFGRHFVESLLNVFLQRANHKANLLRIQFQKNLTLWGNFLSSV